MKYIEVQKQDAAAIRWLHDGTSKDGTRHVLEGLYVEGDITVVTDGFQLRIAPTPEPLKEFDGDLVKLEKLPRASGDVVKTHLIEDGKFPDWRGIIPTGKPAFQIAVNAGLLANLVKDMGNVDNVIEFSFYSSTQPLIVKSVENYAILMPMHLSEPEKLFDPINPPELEESN